MIVDKSVALGRPVTGMPLTPQLPFKNWVVYRLNAGLHHVICIDKVNILSPELSHDFQLLVKLFAVDSIINSFFRADWYKQSIVKARLSLVCFSLAETIDSFIRRHF